ncbi:hypothetical protein JOC75_000444 [Metabacillus crassostreae]|uniref:hypothetical protein n=1 Tax=Metabacillus crassostreae TaxID=929098 RepID=UPI00195DCD32|nr:hypothetical protein [Metabacillus crassostreae]MBM7602474.1 hypothetical protein [Metabacillus crassostreae]
MKYQQRDFNTVLKEKIINNEMVLKDYIEKLLRKHKSAFAKRNLLLDAGFVKEGKNHFKPEYSSSISIGIANDNGEIIDLRIIRIWKCERYILGLPTSFTIPVSKIIGELLDQTIEEIKEELNEYIDELIGTDSPKLREIFLDEEIDKQGFVSIVNNIYKQDCFIYAIIPKYEKELLTELSNDFISVNSFPLPYIFPKEIGYLGYVKDSYKQYVYEFYLHSPMINHLVFSNIDASEHLREITKKNLDISQLFELNKIPHMTIGPDGQWLKIVDY